LAESKNVLILTLLDITVKKEKIGVESIGLRLWQGCCLPPRLPEGEGRFKTNLLIYLLNNMKKPKKPKKQGPGTGAPAVKQNGDGAETWSGCWPLGPRDPNLQKNDQLIEQVRQIIAATPEVRPEKVEPLREAVEQGTYEIDARKLANCLIAKIILDR
jgi:negative regulator of flagellin synthesis FlgM